jgi:hypothetical protein
MDRADKMDKAVKAVEAVEADVLPPVRPDRLLLTALLVLSALL